MRRARIDLRVRVDEKDLWEAYARSKGMGLSELIRRAVNALVRLDTKPDSLRKH